MPPEFDARLLRKGDAAAKVRNEAEAQARSSRDLERATFDGVLGRDEGAAAPRGAAVHHEQAAAGVALPGQEDDDGGAAAVRRHPAAGRRRAGRSRSPTCEPTRSASPIRRSTKCATTSAASSATHYVPEQANRYKVKATAQDAHEAIRPTSMAYHPDAVRAHLTPDQYYLYRLIWNRFVASQMTPAVFDDTTVDITAGDYLFRAKGSVPKFAGWLAVYGQGTGEADESERTEQPTPTPAALRADAEDDAGDGVLPVLTEGQTLDVAGDHARAEVHAAAAALQRRLARQGARRERHRPAEHLRVDHQRAAGARLREQDRRAVPPDDSRPAPRRRAAASGVRRHPRRRVHRADGRPARRDREGQGGLRGDACRPSTRASRRT